MYEPTQRCVLLPVYACFQRQMLNKERHSKRGTARACSSESGSKERRCKSSKKEHKGAQMSREVAQWPRVEAEADRQTG